MRANSNPERSYGLSETERVLDKLLWSKFIDKCDHLSWNIKMQANNVVDLSSFREKEPINNVSLERRNTQFKVLQFIKK